MREREERHFFKKKFDIDIMKEYERLETIGKIPLNRLRDRDTLIEATNDVQDNARRANQVHLKARRLHELYLVDYRARLSKLKRRAIVRLKGWMEDVGVRKQITEEMVIERLCADDDTRGEYEALVTEELEIREIRDNTRKLAELWEGRRWTLGSQAKLIEAIQEVKLGNREDSDLLESHLKPNRR